MHVQGYGNPPFTYHYKDPLSESVCNLTQIFPVLGLHQRFCQFQQLLLINKALFKGDLFNTGNVKPLPLLKSGNEVGCIQKVVMRAGIQPGKASSQPLYPEFPLRQIGIVDGGNFDFSPCGRFDLLCNFHDLVVIEVKTRYRIIALRVLRLFLDGKCNPVLSELHHSVSARISDVITEDRRSLFSLRYLFQHTGEALSVKNIIAQNQSYMVLSDKIFSNQKSVCKTSGLFLYRIGKRKSQLTSISEQLAKHR